MNIRVFGRWWICKVEREKRPIPRVGATALASGLSDDPDRRDFLLHTHAQYVLLRNNEDSLIATRLVALLVMTSFLTVGWVSAGEAEGRGFEIRLALSILGAILTWSIGYLIKVAAVAANTWRELAVDVERDLYEEIERDGARKPGGPYGQKLLWDTFYPPDTKSNRVKRFVLWGLELGRPNNIIGTVIPRTLLAFWMFAFAITLVIEFL